MNDIVFSCPWCDARQYQNVYENAEIEVVCTRCKKSIGIQTNAQAKPMRIGRLVSITQLMQRPDEVQHGQAQTDIRGNNPSIHIGTVYGSVAVGGNANTTNVYEQTVKIIDDAKNVSDTQKAQAKSVLEHAKTYAAPFLPVVA